MLLPAPMSRQSLVLAAKWQTQLESRFEEIRLRGSQPHGRFDARYTLELKNDPQSALTIALANLWMLERLCNIDILNF